MFATFVATRRPKQSEAKAYASSDVSGRYFLLTMAVTSFVGKRHKGLSWQTCEDLGADRIYVPLGQKKLGMEHAATE